MAGATGMNGGADPGLAVVIVAYNAAGFVADCLESLFAARLPGMKVVVVDNGSRDGTADAVRDWASGTAPELRTDWPFAPDHRAPRPTAFAEHDAARPPAGALPPLTLIRTHANLGFAGGVNRGLRALLADPETDLFWLLNPDTVVPPDTPSAFLRAARAMGRFAAQALLGSQEPLGRLRGRVHLREGIPVVVTYHPAYLLRSPQDKALAWDDLCLAHDTYAAQGQGT